MKKIILIFISCLTVFNMIFMNIAFADEFKEEDNYVQVFTGKSIAADKKLLSSINAGAALVMDTMSGRVLYEKNGYVRRPMASTTKIMTAIVAIEKGDLNDVVTVSKKAANTLGSDISLKIGEKLTLRELLYGLMLKSGNDASVAIAEHIAGSVEAFCGSMNTKAKELGCKNTSFKSPHGLDMPDHYTTPYELALITRYALKNPIFSKIVSTSDMSITGRSLHNTNEMLGAYPGTDGVKTGYTGQAGRCLVTSATRNNWRLISVVLGSPTRNARAQSSKDILDYAFENYKQYTILKSGKYIGNLEVKKGVKKTIPVTAASTITLPLKKEEADALQSQVSYPDNLPAPITNGLVVGSIKFVVNGKVIGESELMVGEDVRRKNMLDYLGDIVKDWGRLMRYQN